MALPWIRAIIPKELECQFQGGQLAWDENGNFKCIFPDEEQEPPTSPPEAPEEDRDHWNPTNPRERNDRGRDTDDEPPQPSPDPLPDPSPPPVRHPDSPDRRDPFKPFGIGIDSITFKRPSIPRRRLPSLERPTDTGLLIFQDPVIGVEQDAYSRVYGCMLHSPITRTPAIFRICESDQGNNNQDGIDDAKNFFEYLIRRIAGVALDDSLTGACVLALNLLPTRIIRYSPKGQLLFTFGCSFLGSQASNFVFQSANAYQSIDGQGHINVKYIQCNPQGDEVDDPTRGLEPTRRDINECFVPIRNFRENEPEQKGMKRQLQVIYEKVIERQDDRGETVQDRVQKQITIPNPISDGLDTETIKGVFPRTLEFGEVKTEMSIIPYGYVRFYSTEDNIEGGQFGSETDDFFDDILTLIDGEEVENSRRYSHRTRNIITGEFNRKKAFLWEWNKGDGKPPLCQTFNLAD